MDWSLCNPNAKHPYLRDVLGFRKVWVYYVAMILDPILRFNWIFYAIYTHNIQHSAILSFFVSFSEICRRGMWSIFRVENEHCTNVNRFRASRDVPLPYALSGPDDTVSMPGETYDPSSQQDPILGSPHGEVRDTSAATTGAEFDLERAATSDSVRRRRTAQQEQQSPQPPPMVRAMSRVGEIMANAHVEDFERKKKPDALGGDIKDVDGNEFRNEDSTDYEDDDEEEEEEEEEAQEAEAEAEGRGEGEDDANGGGSGSGGGEFEDAEDGAGGGGSIDQKTSPY